MSKPSLGTVVDRHFLKRRKINPVRIDPNNKSAAIMLLLMEYRNAPGQLVDGLAGPADARFLQDGNQPLPQERRFRVVLVDMQRPWKQITQRDDWKKYDVDRNQLMADNVLKDLHEHSADCSGRRPFRQQLARRHFKGDFGMGRHHDD